MKKNLGIIIFVLLFSGLIFTCSQTAFASSVKAVPTDSSYNVSDRTMNGAVFVTGDYYSGTWNLYISKDGITKTISTGFCGGKVLTDGKTVYYAEKASGKFYLYQYLIDKGSKKKMGTLGKPSWGVDLEGFYNNKIYFIMDSPEGKFACFNLKKKSVKKLAGGYAVTSAKQIGKYFILTDGTGAGYSYLGLYNAESGKMKKIVSSPCTWIVTSKYVYYIGIKKGYLFSKPMTITVVRYTMSSGKKKTFIKSMNVYGIEEFTPKYLKYKDSKGKIKKKSW